MASFLANAETIKSKLLTKHGVSIREVEQCFENQTGKALVDNREEHQTDPPSLWFIAQTNNRRTLKVVYILVNGKIIIKTCYEPNDIEKFIYQKYGE